MLHMRWTFTVTALGQRIYSWSDCMSVSLYYSSHWIQQKFGLRFAIRMTFEDGLCFSNRLDFENIGLYKIEHEIASNDTLLPIECLFRLLLGVHFVIILRPILLAYRLCYNWSGSTSIILIWLHAWIYWQDGKIQFIKGCGFSLHGSFPHGCAKGF